MITTCRDSGCCAGSDGRATAIANTTTTTLTTRFAFMAFLSAPAMSTL
jgi:hypothetical protein